MAEKDFPALSRLPVASGSRGTNRGLILPERFRGGYAFGGAKKDSALSCLDCFSKVRTIPDEQGFIQAIAANLLIESYRTSVAVIALSMEITG
ncbi:hypothetical protein [Nitrosomonas sp.]|uniref:hypothetical protein n=1 Tax=Nitrosomonas sp. TaxID=42353 RepID=UPI001600A1A4